MTEQTKASIRRWRVARSIVLGTILATGAAAAAVAVFAPRPACHGGGHHASRGYVYSGIGVELEQRADQYVVRRVFAGSPADGVVQPGAVLVRANGYRAQDLGGWTGLIRGEPGTTVELELAYHCGGHETVTLKRDTIRVRR